MRKINKLLLSFITVLFMVTMLVGCNTNQFNPNTKGAEYGKDETINLNFTNSTAMLANDYNWKPEEKNFKDNYLWAMKRAKKIGVEKNSNGENVAYTIDAYMENGKMVTKKLTYPVRPKRVISLFESHLNLAWEMGLRNIVGRNATTQKDILYKEIEQNKKIQVIGEGTVLASTEKLLALKPDLVLVDAMHTSEDTKKKLLDAKIVFVEIVSSSVQWYLRSAKLMAAIAGRADLFEKISKEMVQDITTIKSVVATYTKEKGLTKDKEDNRLKVALTLLEAGAQNKTLLGYSDRSANGGIIKTLAGRNIYEGKENPSAQNPMFMNRIPINNDELVQFNPKKIFVQLHGELSEKEMQKYITENILNNQIYQSLDAVKNKEVYALPAKLFLYRPNKLYPLVYKYFAEKLFNAGKDGGIIIPQLNCEK